MAARLTPARLACPDGYRARLAAVTGPLAARFEAFDAALEAHHPVAVPHQHLAILAVRPGRQGQRTGTTLLAARHATLDAEGIPAFLEASSPTTRRIYLRHGYIDYGARIDLPGGPALYPMRRPRDTPRAGDRPGACTPPGAPTAGRSWTAEEPSLPACCECLQTGPGRREAAVIIGGCCGPGWQVFNADPRLGSQIRTGSPPL